MPDEPAERPYRQIHDSAWGLLREPPAAEPATRPLTDGEPTQIGEPALTIPTQNRSTPRPALAPAPPPPLPSTEPEMQIALWGATSSGKSTYLWTLPLAAEQQGWTISPLDEASEEYKVRAETDLITERLLPLPTADEVLIRWQLERPPNVEGPWWRRRRIPGSRIVLRTIERRGGDFETLTQGVADQLAYADGIVYLFDPDRELNPNAVDNVRFFIAAMNRLQRRTAARGRMVGGRLPHHIAVCITKLDAVKVFAKAREGFWVTQSAEWPHFPQVAPHHAKPFFDWLCGLTELGDAASFVRDRIVANFLPERVMYFVCSAIGFGLHQRRQGEGRGQFNLSDFGNLTSEGDRVRSLPRPINVLEPLVALEQSRRFSDGFP